MEQDLAREIGEIRRFNRFYTRWVGALNLHHLGSDFSLAEARILFEIAHAPGLLARDIVERLGVDAGYLSRIVRRFENKCLVERHRSQSDGRAAALQLTERGQKLFGDLDAKAAARIHEEIIHLSDQERTGLTAALGIACCLLNGDRDEQRGELVLREPRSGDYGWAIERHGVIYSAEFGWSTRFEGLVAKLFGEFAINHEPARERSWIADLGGERAGCVFVVEREATVAQLRCLLVEPKARGHGVGRALVDACISFARDAGYERMMLWTNKGLDSARKIYEAVGFELVEEQPHEDFGVPLIGQNWEMAL